jgi:hypothetical protein
MIKMGYRKIKDLRRPGNKNPHTNKQTEAVRKTGTLNFIKNNPMKNPETVSRVSKKSIGRKRPDLTLRNLKDNPMKNNKSVEKSRKAHTGKKNIKESIRKIGIPLPHLKDFQFKQGHPSPMKNPETVKKRKKTFEDKALARSTKFKKGHVPTNKTHFAKNNHYLFKKGNIPWNKGKRGLQTAWNKGLKNSSNNKIERRTK